MKKFYFLLLAMVCSLAGMAQTAVKVTAKNGPVSAPEEGKLYAILCNSQQSYTTWMLDDGSNSAPIATKGLTIDVDELVGTQYFWKITPEEGDGVFSFQNYATEKYISVDGTGDGGTVSMSATKTNAIISTEDGNDYIAIKNPTSDAWIDMGWNGTSNCTWSGGISGSRRMQIFEVEVEEVTSREEIVNDLKTIYTSYNSDHPLTDFEAGTTYGNYGAAEIQAYSEAMDYAANIIDAEGGDLSDEEIKAAGKAIEDAYTALAASRIPYAMDIKPGYYVIKNALTFTTSSTQVPTSCTNCGSSDISYSEAEESYVCNACGTPLEEVTVKKYWQKAIYDNKGYACWKTFQPTADFLFKIEASDKPLQYKVTNVLNGNTFDKVSTSTNVTMSQTDSLMCFDWRYDNVNVRTDSLGLDENIKKVTTVNIRLASQAERDYYYIHAGGHSAGAGVSGNIVGWSTGSGTEVGATDWYLEEIDEATALAWIDAASPVKKIRAAIDSIANIETAFASQKTIAIDEIADIDTSVQVANSGTFTSPWTEATEGSVDNLFDESASTYWHSAWSSSATGVAVNTTPGTNYFVISDLSNQLAGGLAISITRRSATNDHPTKFTVYGTNDYNAAQDNGYGYDGLVWTELGELSTPYGSNTETVTSNAIAFEGSYSYYKFLCTETNPVEYNRGYFHMSELRVYPATIGHGAETTQATARASQIKAVEDALAAWYAKGYTEENVTDPEDATFKSLYTAVYNAYAAWTEVYADPAPMRTAATKALNYAALIVEGTNPGEWPAGSGQAEIDNAINAEKAYNNAGAYSAAEVAAMAKAINDAMDAVAAKANQVDPSKWYTIRFATEEEYNLWGWDKSGAVSTDYGDLYGLKIAPAATTEEAGNYEQITGEDVRKDIYIRFCSDDPDEGQFRFVDAGNGKYYLQHVSGWYVGTNGKLGSHPALFSTRAIGCGKSLIKVQDLQGNDIETGTTPSYLHAQVAGHTLVAWSADAIDSRSALYIEEASVSPEVATTQFETILPGTQRFYTSPAAISNVAGAQLYTFDGYEKTDNGVKIAFSKTDAAEAGKAVLMVVDGDYPATATDDDKANAISYSLGNTFAAVPDSTQALVGNYTYQWVNAADTAYTVTIYNNELTVASGQDNTDCSRDISAYTGAINLAKAEVISTEGKDLVVTIEGADPSVDIKEVVAKAINTTGKIYTIDGKYMGTGNIGTASKMGRGVYIINGVKVSVK